MTVMTEMARRSVIGGGLSLLAASVPLSGMARAANEPGPKNGSVARVTSGHTLDLVSGDRVRLAGIRAPIREASYATAAREGLAKLVEGQPVQLEYGDDSRDRYDRLLAQLYRTKNGSDPLWVQGEAVSQGLARVFSWPGDRFDVTALLKKEALARAAKRGLWALPDYEVRSPDANALAQDVDSFQLVEGIVVQTAEVRSRLYLNFGADYRTDFTVVIPKSRRKAFRDWDPLSLEGARIRVRGWIELVNGPMIEVTTPERIEILS